MFIFITHDRALLVQTICYQELKSFSVAGHRKAASAPPEKSMDFSKRVFFFFFGFSMFEWGGGL